MRITPLTILLLVLAAGCQTPRVATPGRQFAGAAGGPAAPPGTGADSWPAGNAVIVEPENALGVQPASFAQDEALELPQPAPGGPLSLPEIEQQALAANPAVAQARAEVEAVRGRWLQVGLPPNPIVGYSAAEVGIDGGSGQQGGFVEQSFVRGGKRALSRAVADKEIEIAEQRLAAVQQRVLTDVRTGYVSFLIGSRREQLAGELVSIGRRAVDDTAELLRKGELRRADLLRAEAELASLNVLQKNAAVQKFTAWRQLALVTGTPDLPMPELAVEQVQQRLGEARSISLRRELAIEQLLQSSPEVAQALTDVERARRAIDRARAEAVPDVNVQVTLQRDAGTLETVAGIQVGVPVPCRNWNQGGIQQAQAELVSAERAVDATELRLLRQFEPVYQRYANARNQVDEYAAEPGGILEKVRETLELTSIGYQAEEFSSLDMLTAQRIYNQANLAYLEALHDLWVAAIEIEGLLLKDSLQAAPQ